MTGGESTGEESFGAHLELSGDPYSVQRWFAERGWTDGLPIIPPEEDRVAALVEASHRSATETVGDVPPLGGTATVANIAANAVMAGCEALHFPTVLAAVEAMLTPDFNLYLTQVTTHPAAPLLIVHGPEARRIGVNGGVGVFGPGFTANAVIGRALRLILLNLGGARPGVRDFATQGSPAKFSFCIAENVEQSPWPELHTTRGFSADASAVTLVAGAEGPRSVNDHASDTPTGLLDVVADSMGSLAVNNWYASNGGSEYVVVLGPEHAALAGDAGWQRSDVQHYLFHRSMRTARDLAKGVMWKSRMWSAWVTALAADPDAAMPIVEDAEHIMVLVAGGYGKFSSVIPTMGNVARAVTVPISTVA
jgi:hypothetical protein